MTAIDSTISTYIAEANVVLEILILEVYINLREY